MFTKLFVTALVALPIVAATSAQCTRSYTVAAGDICDAISAKENVSTYQLATLNPSINAECTNLQIGQVLCLGTEGEDCQDVWVVEADDTCDSIAECASTNATMLLLNNPNINDQCTNIYIGQVLCVADQVQSPPLPAGIPSPSVASGFGTAPATAVAPIQTSAAAPAQTSAASSDGDDDNLPWCDELEGDDSEW